MNAVEPELWPASPLRLASSTAEKPRAPTILGTLQSVTAKMPCTIFLTAFGARTLGSRVLTTGYAASAETGALAGFKNWSVACDNIRSCTAAAGDHDRVSALALALTGSGEPEAPPVIRVAFHHSVDAPAISWSA